MNTAQQIMKNTNDARMSCAVRVSHIVISGHSSIHPSTTAVQL